MSSIMSQSVMKLIASEANTDIETMTTSDLVSRRQEIRNLVHTMKGEDNLRRNQMIQINLEITREINNRVSKAEEVNQKDLEKQYNKEKDDRELVRSKQIHERASIRLARVKQEFEIASIAQREAVVKHYNGHSPLEMTVEEFVKMHG